MRLGNPGGLTENLRVGNLRSLFDFRLDLSQCEQCHDAVYRYYMITLSQEVQK
jgi:hypothetical protein